MVGIQFSLTFIVFLKLQFTPVPIFLVTNPMQFDRQHKSCSYYQHKIIILNQPHATLGQVSAVFILKNTPYVKQNSKQEGLFKSKSLT